MQTKAILSGDEIENLRLLGDRVRLARLRRNLTQAEFAERMGVRRMTVVSLEKGRRESRSRHCSRLSRCSAIPSASAISLPPIPSVRTWRSRPAGSARGAGPVWRTSRAGRLDRLVVFRWQGGGYVPAGELTFEGAGEKRIGRFGYARSYLALDGARAIDPLACRWCAGPFRAVPRSSRWRSTTPAPMGGASRCYSAHSRAPSSRCRNISPSAGWTERAISHSGRRPSRGRNPGCRTRSLWSRCPA